MKLAAFLRSLASALFHRSRFDRDLDDELRAHIHDRAADLERSGLPAAEALRRARLEFGALDKAKEQCREALGVHFLHTLAQDLRYAARTLRKSPGFAAVAILTLALGIGANTAMFSIVNVVLLRPLPFAEAGRLVKVSGLELFLNPAEPQTLEDVSVYQTGEFNLAGAGAPQRIAAAAVSQNFFDLFRVHPVLGRTFLPGEEAALHPAAAILSDSLWREHFSADPEIVGKQIQLNGSAFTVVGVMPAGFTFPQRTLAWVTAPPAGGSVFGGNIIYYADLARLRPGVTLAQASAEIRLIQMRHIPKTARPTSSVVPLRETMVSEIQPALLLLLGAVGLVLLIACANVANLILARSAGRFRELAIRSAIGASRGRLVRQFLTESILLSLLGGSLGILIGAWAIAVAKPFVSTFIPFGSSLALDVRVILFAFAAMALSGLITGIIPALQSSRPDMNDALKDNTANLGRVQLSRHRLGSLLSVAQIAAALVLLVGAGLLLRSFGKLLDVSIGFRPAGVEAAQISLLGPAYDRPEARLQFYERVRAAAIALPGVRDAALVNAVPLAPGGVAGFAIKAAGSPANDPGVTSLYITASPGYFQTMGIPLLAGHDFTSADRQSSSESGDDSVHSGAPGLVAAEKTPAPVPSAASAGKASATTAAILSRSLADQLWPGENPTGKEVDFLGESVRVVGVVGDVHFAGPDEKTWPIIYFPIFEQIGDTAYLVVRTAADPTATAAALRGVVSSVDKTEPISTVTTMDDLVSHSVADARFRTILLGLFAGIAFLLAIVGIYGVVSYAVGQRTREIGIRIALGAGRSDVLRMVLRGGALLASAGIAAGLVASLALAHLLTHFLFGVRPTDPLTFAAVAAALLLVALAACYIPARRAMRVDPLTAIRHE